MEEVNQKSWFGRNWIWLLPVGGCLTIILLFVFGVGAIFFGVKNAIENSGPYEYALQEARLNDDVAYHLGDPIETNGIMQGNISLQNSDSGHVDIKIPIKGSEGEGTIFVVGEKIDGEWVYERLYVLIKETQDEINLIDKNLEGI